MVARPVVIDCVGPLTPSFVELFATALAAVAITSPVLVQFKRATLPDLKGLVAINALLENRGGDAAFVASSSRWRSIMHENGIAADRIRAEEDTTAKRRIILAAASGRPTPPVAPAALGSA